MGCCGGKDPKVSEEPPRRVNPGVAALGQREDDSRRRLEQSWEEGVWEILSRSQRKSMKAAAAGDELLQQLIDRLRMSGVPESDIVRDATKLLATLDAAVNARARAGALTDVLAAQGALSSAAYVQELETDGRRKLLQDALGGLCELLRWESNERAMLLLPRTPYLGLEFAAGVVRSTEVGDVESLRVVSSAGPAKDAGVEAEDVVERINGRRVPQLADAQGVLRQVRPGDSVTLQVWRREAGGRKPESVTVTFTAGEAGRYGKADSWQPAQRERRYLPTYGASSPVIEDATPAPGNTYRSRRLSIDAPGQSPRPQFGVGTPKFAESPTARHSPGRRGSPAGLHSSAFDGVSPPLPPIAPRSPSRERRASPSPQASPTGGSKIRSPSSERGRKLRTSSFAPRDPPSGGGRQSPKRR
eukprot:Hpha_TRINITY_DN15870_c3_g1::TRINITY_DN15870_c3_g1_i1::g.187394::m.187394